MHKTITIAIIALLASVARAEGQHVYPTNPAPDKAAFYGQLGRDTLVVTNPAALTPGGGVNTNQVRDIVEPMIGEAIDDAIDEIEDHISGKRGLTNNTCHKTEVVGGWSWAIVESTDPSFLISLLDGKSPLLSHDPDNVDRWYPPALEGFFAEAVDAEFEYSVTFIYYSHAGTLYSRVTATDTRSTVCTSNELYTTTSYVSNAVSAAFSTNNPAFVSAVKGITTQPSPTILLYDYVRQRWYHGKLADGVLQWEEKQ